MRSGLYAARIIAFLDVLGFGNLVENSKDNPKEILNIYECLNTAKQIAQQWSQPRVRLNRELRESLKKFNYHTFSDTITMSCPYNSLDDLFLMIIWLMFFQYVMLIQRNIFVRGAIVYGKLYDDTTHIFGPAMNKAYKLEKEKAIWPRVVVDDSILTILTEEERSALRITHFEEDDIGTVYLNYLQTLFQIFARQQMPTMRVLLNFDPIKLLRNHRNLVMRTVQQAKTIVDSEERGHVANKLGFLVEYHNGVVDRLCQATRKLLENDDLTRNIIYTTTVSAMHRRLIVPNQEFYDSIVESDYLEHLGFDMPLITLAVASIFSSSRDLKDILGTSLGKSEPCDPKELSRRICAKCHRHLTGLRGTLGRLKVTEEDLHMP